MTDTLKKVFLTIAALAALALGGAAIAGATSGGNDNAAQEQSEPGDREDRGDKTLTGATADRAREAALAKTGGGAAGSVESESEKGATYGVEVTTPDGSKVDVFLDDRFNAIAVESDGE
jgi:uncharacterized membrane protein YkoI